MIVRVAVAAARRAAPFAGLLALWSGVAALGWSDRSTLPPPWEVLRAAWDFVTGRGWPSP
jgi:ABC-type nitrate/sulfonate/bicarbonate transport system permease component